MSFDLEKYISRYTPRSSTALLRLTHISTTSSDSALKSAAKELLKDELKKTYDSGRYARLFSDKDGREIDKKWVTETGEMCFKEQTRLESTLATSKTNLTKDLILKNYTSLASFYALRGDLPSSLKNYVRSRDFCTTQRDVGEMCVCVIVTSINMSNYSQVNSYVHKGEHTPELKSDTLTCAKFRAAAGLSLLHDSAYSEACKVFVNLPSELGSNFNQVITGEDIAVYGVILGLSVYNRDEIKSLIIDSVSFNTYLELNPMINDIVQCYYKGNYGKTLSLLSAMYNELTYDIHLAQHIGKLFECIRDKLITQYFIPYESCSLIKVAALFEISVDEIEASVVRLIKNNVIRGRVNSRLKAFTKTKEEKRDVAIKHVIDIGLRFVSDAEGMLLRLSCIDAGVYVDCGPGGSSGSSGGGRKKGGARNKRRGGRGKEAMEDYAESGDEEEEEEGAEDMDIPTDV